MKTKTLQALAVALGVGMCSMAHAQSTYTSPAKWDNFYPVSDKGEVTKATKKAAKETALMELPAPTAEAVPAPKAELAPTPTTEATPATPLSDVEPLPVPTPVPMSVDAPSASIQHVISGECCEPARLPLANYFGSLNLLFLTLEEGWNHEVVTGLGSDFNSSIVDPNGTTGFDVTFGRYLDCGRFGLGITYLLWNPSSESVTRLGGAGTIIPRNPGYNNITNGNTTNTVYDDIATSAQGTRLTRDLQFQGIEANLSCFGLMGARRIARKGCCPGLFGTSLGRRLAMKHCKGYGGATGPLVRGCGGRVRVVTSHGFRWLQIRDDLEYAYNIDAVAGYQADDLYENVEIENNLFGYQFGGRLTYCLTSCLSLNVGGKFGLYGNRAEMRHRVGTLTDVAYRNGVSGDLINTESSDTVLSTLGELDLGLSYRIGCAWSINGGYRLLGVTGVANAVDSVPTNYSSVARSGQVYADDSYLLHGGYVGLSYNW